MYTTRTKERNKMTDNGETANYKPPKRSKKAKKKKITIESPSGPAKITIFTHYRCANTDDHFVASWFNGSSEHTNFQSNYSEYVCL